MPKYINPNELSALGSANKGSGDLGQLDKINNMLDKGLAIFDKIASLRKFKEEQGNKQSGNAQIEIKAHKETEKIINSSLTPQTPQKEYEINFKIKEAEEQLNKFLSSVKEEDKKKSLGEFIKGDFKKWKEAGLVHVFIESLLKDYTELKEK